jgi:hypothetical protein
MFLAKEPNYLVVKTGKREHGPIISFNIAAASITNFHTRIGQ